MATVTLPSFATEGVEVAAAVVPRWIGSLVTSLTVAPFFFGGGDFFAVVAPALVTPPFLVERCELRAMLS